MGISRRAATHRKVPLPLRLDILARELCKCPCHEKKRKIHEGKHCSCNPTYGVDGHALTVVQLREKEDT